MWQPEADRSAWQSADLMIKAAALLADQDSKGITGTIATDREFCTWHGLLDL